MKKKVWAKIQRKDLIFILIWNAICLVAGILIMRPIFETNDDLTIVEMVSGGLWGKDAHVVYQNCLLGKLYVLLYSITKKVPWYGLVQYFFLWLAFSVIVYIIWKRLPKTLGITLSVLILCFWGYECYIKMQYTKTAGVLAIAGILLIFHECTKENLSKKRLILGVVLSCVGSMYRYEQFIACVAMMSGLGVYQLLKNWREDDLRKIWKPVLWVVITLVVSLGLKEFDTYIYESEPQWKQYTEYNDLRTKLLGYDFPKYKDYEEQYTKWGITEDAYNLWRHWNFGDPDLFNVETMKKLVSLTSEKALNGELIEDFFDKFPKKYFQTPVFYGVLLLIFLGILERKNNKEKYGTWIYEFLLFVGLYLYLFWRGRYDRNHVDVSLWLAVLLVIIWTLDETRQWFERQAGIVLCAAILILGQYQWYDNWRINAMKSGLDARSVLEELREDPGHLYITKNKTLSYAIGYGPLDVMPEEISSNFTFFGGWETNTVMWKEKLARYDVVNLYKDSINNEKVRLIDDEIDVTMNYIHTYYDENAKAIQMDTYKGYPVYKIVSEDQE